MSQKTNILPETQEIRFFERMKAKEIEYGGMLAISIIALQNLLSYTSLDGYSILAFKLFALAIPLLAYFFVAKAHQNFSSKWTELGGNAGLSFAALGLWLLIYRLSAEAGFLFLLVGLPAYVSGGNVIKTMFDEELVLITYLLKILHWICCQYSKFVEKKKLKKSKNTKQQVTTNSTPF